MAARIDTLNERIPVQEYRRTETRRSRHRSRAGSSREPGRRHRTRTIVVGYDERVPCACMRVQRCFLEGENGSDAPVPVLEVLLPLCAGAAGKGVSKRCSHRGPGLAIVLAYRCRVISESESVDELCEELWFEGSYRDMFVV